MNPTETEKYHNIHFECERSLELDVCAGLTDFESRARHLSTKHRSARRERDVARLAQYKLVAVQNITAIAQNPCIAETITIIYVHRRSGQVLWYVLVNIAVEVSPVPP